MTKDTSHCIINVNKLQMNKDISHCISSVNKGGTFTALEV